MWSEKELKSKQKVKENQENNERMWNKNWIEK